MPSGTYIANIERASDRTLKADLAAHLYRETLNERREEMIREQALDLVQKGEEFYPWTFEHFEEAIANAPKGHRALVFATIATAVDFDLDNNSSNHIALVAVRQLVERYWLESAFHHIKGDE